MNKVAGTRGYGDAVDAFAKASFSLAFEEISKDFLKFLPRRSGRVLDAGAGVGQNAAALARRGYSVVAVEPLEGFLQIAKATYGAANILWLQDSLPKLEKVDAGAEGFDFILMDGVWHHLNPDERRACIRRLSDLLKEGGICAISLRNGPAGAGKHVFPTSSAEVCRYADEFGFAVLLNLKNQPSKMQNKQDVVWSRVAIQKLANS